jgi:hypothetical protein
VWFAICCALWLAICFALWLAICFALCFAVCFAVGLGWGSRFGGEAAIGGAVVGGSVIGFGVGWGRRLGRRFADRFAVAAEVKKVIGRFGDRFEFIVVARAVPRLDGSGQFVFEFGKDGGRDPFPAFTIHRVGDVGIELLRRFGGVRDLKFGATLVAERRTEVVFVVATVAVRRQLAAGHRDEGAAGAIDDLEVTDDEAMIEGNATERP